MFFVWRFWQAADSSLGLLLHRSHVTGCVSPLPHSPPPHTHRTVTHHLNPCAPSEYITPYPTSHYWTPARDGTATFKRDYICVCASVSVLPLTAPWGGYPQEVIRPNRRKLNKNSACVQGGYYIRLTLRITSSVRAILIFFFFMEISVTKKRKKKDTTQSVQTHI